MGSAFLKGNDPGNKSFFGLRSLRGTAIMLRLVQVDFTSYHYVKPAPKSGVVQTMNDGFQIKFRYGPVLVNIFIK